MGKAEDLKVLLSRYRTATEQLGTEEDQEDFLRIAHAAKRVIDALEQFDFALAKREAYNFSWQLTDCYVQQPEECKELAKAIEDIRRDRY